MQKIVVIPARLASTRLPRKLLLDLGGKSILQRVYEQCLLAEEIDAVYIATDSIEIYKACQAFTDRLIMTAETHSSGTDRIAEAVATLDCQVIVNVQGDEPFINPKLITQIAQAVEGNTAPMSSAMTRITQTDELRDPNVVKVVVNHQSQALYFSRSVIPHHRDDWETLMHKHASIPETLPFYKHIGIYGYSRDFLLYYTQMAPSYLESVEKLEQLRVLENGYAIQMIETAEIGLGIDTPEDYQEAQAILAQGTHS